MTHANLAGMAGMLLQTRLTMPNSKPKAKPRPKRFPRTPDLLRQRLARVNEYFTAADIGAACGIGESAAKGTVMDARAAGLAELHQHGRPCIYKKATP